MLYFLIFFDFFDFSFHPKNRVNAYEKSKNVYENHAEIRGNQENLENTKFDAKSGVNREDFGNPKNNYFKPGKTIFTSDLRWFTKENDSNISLSDFPASK